MEVVIFDDEPKITVKQTPTVTNPAGSQNNIEYVDEKINFVKNEQEDPFVTSEKVKTQFWDNQIEIKAALVKYEQDGENKYTIENITYDGYELAYSPYNGGTPQEFNPELFKVIDENGNSIYKDYIYVKDENGNFICDENGKYILKDGIHYDKGKYYRDAPESDWGLNVIKTENTNFDGEIQAFEDNTSEAIVIDLYGKLAYGLTIEFGAFFSGGDNTNTTGYDSESEIVLIIFYKKGVPVYSTVQTGSENGKSLYNSADAILDGFDQVIILPVHNSENSDFTIQGLDFVTKGNEPVIINRGTVSAQSGADGFADAYSEAHAGFDLEKIIEQAGGTLAEDGTPASFTVLVDRIEYTAKLELVAGSSGESILTALLEKPGQELDGKQLFYATLDKEGQWTLEQYYAFQVQKGEEETSSQFELVFKTEDTDGDTATGSVSVTTVLPESKTITIETDDSGLPTGTTLGEGNEVSGDTVIDGSTGGDDAIIGTQGGDLIFGQDGNDIVLGDGNDTTLKDIAEKLGVENNQPTVDSMTQAIQKLEDDPQSNNFKNFLDSVEGTSNDGNDQLFGGSGDDLLFGMGGDDYLNGGAGEDYLFGGSGNDIIVYDENDYMVSGGDGIDFMVTDKDSITLDTLGESGRNGMEGPIVEGIDVLIKGDEALSLTNMEQLSKDYGVTIEGNNTISLDDRWSPVEGNDHTFAFNDSSLTIEISNELTVQAAKQQIEQG